MTEKQTKDRSPSFPFIPLEEVVKRLQAFEQTFGRHPAPASKAGLAWGMKENSSQANQTLAAMRAFGLVRYEGSAAERKALLTDDARTYLRAQQESLKRDVLKKIALEPAQIKKFWSVWGADRPPDPVCLDDLVLKHAFTDSAAHTFLKVYDATIDYAGLTDSDTIVEPTDDDADAAPPASDIKVGDLVQIEIGGAFQLSEPKRVRAIQGHEGHDWVFIEGSETGFEMSQVVLQEPAAAPTAKSPPRLAIDQPLAPSGGWSEETLIDDAGDEIKIRYLGKASVERYEFIRDYLDFKIARLKPKPAKATDDAQGQG
ncbi:hypothetical protein [Pelagibacterium sediminicola]|uniref:hypothetical protein n=1 Tax=Pelagibacterium sediminicola TaxID=2248761 RepID=UPI000E31A4E2|nr:hypothetical protein [Pelagibacterium sediminicola]